MKFKVEFVTEQSDDVILNIVNMFQYTNRFDMFDTLEECPEGIILMALEQDFGDGVIDSWIIDAYLDDLDITIIKE